MKKYTLEIKTPDTILYSGEIISLMVPHPEGLEGYLADHEPVLKELIPGKVRYTSEENRDPEEIEISGGFLVFSENQATLFIR